MAVRPNAGTKGVPRAEREEQILDVASVAFGTDGFAATNIADVARAAGISKPLVYNYFGSKEGLFERCLGIAADLLVTEIERSAGLGAVGVERGLVTLDGVFGVLEGRVWAWQVANDPTAPATGTIAEVQDACRRRLEELAAEGVGELLRLAGVTDPLDVEAMTAVWGQVFATLVTWWTQHPDVTREQMTERCVRLFDAVLAR